jgi:anti-anti-sigma factor
VTLPARVDVSTVTEIREALHAAVGAAPGRIVVDLARVELIDATGLGVLVGAHRRAVGSGQTFVLHRVPARVARMLHVTRLSRVLCAGSR